MREMKYGKPDMANLPYELGKAIIDEIMNSKPVNRKQLRKEADELERQIIEIRRKEAHEKQ